MRLRPLPREITDRADAEALEVSAKRLFDRIFRVKRESGQFILLDRRSGVVVGAGFCRPGGREELDF